MRVSAALAFGLAPVAMGAIAPKNFIFIVPDGMAPASQTLVRTYQSMLNSTPDAPEIGPLPVDITPIGNTRTHSSNSLITDSAAAGTALACGFKTENGAISVLPDGQPVGSILEAAKLNGFLTALVVTSTINHATPAAYSSHVLDRNNYTAIAEQQIGYSHPLGQSVDILLGGGRCYFKPQSEEDSCRDDDIDLFAFAKEKGYHVAQNRSAFDELDNGLGKIRLPYIGLFNDGQMSYEIDRQQQPEDVREPSLLEMAKTALNSIHRASRCKDTGYFMMIEASRIDHASHAHDSVAHLWDTLEYNNVVDHVTQWINKHPDTAMISVADHETGGLTLTGYDPRPLEAGKHSIEYLSSKWNEYDGSDRRGYLIDEILPAYGLSDVSDEDVDSILNGDLALGLDTITSKRTGISWSTGDHTGVDTTLYAYASGDMGDQIKIDLAGTHDNTELPRYIQKALNISLDEVTALLRENGTSRLP